MSYLLDTNHCSDIINANPQVIKALATRAESTISVSIITYAELLKANIFKHFAPKEKAKRRGVNIGSLGFTDHDLWIVATAIQHSLTLVSADSDLQRIHQVQSFSLESWR